MEEKKEYVSPELSAFELKAEGLVCVSVTDPFDGEETLW